MACISYELYIENQKLKSTAQQQEAAVERLTVQTQQLSKRLELLESFKSSEIVSGALVPTASAAVPTASAAAVPTALAAAVPTASAAAVPTASAAVPTAATSARTTPTATSASAAKVMKRENKIDKIEVVVYLQKLNETLPQEGQALVNVAIAALQKVIKINQQNCDRQKKHNEKVVDPEEDITNRDIKNAKRRKIDL